MEKVIDNYITVVLPYDKDIKKLPPKLFRIPRINTEYHRGNNKIATKPISKTLRITEDGVGYHIKKLKKDGLNM